MQTASPSPERLTGLARSWDIVRETWPGARIVKTALAAGIAWWLGSTLTQQMPIFGVFLAIGSMQPTVAQSLRQISAALVGIVLGVTVGWLSHLIPQGPPPLMVAGLIGLALTITVRMRAHGWLGAELAGNAFLAYALFGGDPLFNGLARLGEALLGSVVGLTVNALVLPPDYRGEARRAVEDLTNELVQAVQQVVEDTAEAPEPEVAREHYLVTRTLIENAQERVKESERTRQALRFSPMLHFSPLRRGHVAEATRYVDAVALFAGTFEYVGAASRAVWHLSRRRHTPDTTPDAWRRLGANLAGAIQYVRTYVLTGSEESRQSAEVATRFALREHASLVTSRRLGEVPEDLDRAAVLASLEQLLDDLRTAVRGGAAGVSTAAERMVP